MEQAELERVISSLPKKNQPSKNASFDLLPGGSDRKFIRIRDQDRTLILMLSNPEDKEFGNYINIQNFLFNKKLGVPEIYFHDETNRVLLMEDIGDSSVEYLATHVLKGEDVIKLYKGVIAFLVELQVEGFKGHEDCLPLKIRRYDSDMMRQETRYFCEYFLEKFCHIEDKKTRLLDKEFDLLAKNLADESPYFMHRDFQSQNIFVLGGKIRIVDFQSARQGLLAYDLAAILKDAYVVLKNDARQLLINYYLGYLDKIKGIKLDVTRFMSTFFLTALQRNMQALGAFAYLSMEKEKKRYIRFIPAGLKYLQEALAGDEGKKFSKLRKMLTEDVPKYVAGGK